MNKNEWKKKRAEIPHCEATMILPNVCRTVIAIHVHHNQTRKRCLLVFQYHFSARLEISLRPHDRELFI